MSLVWELHREENPLTLWGFTLGDVVNGVVTRVKNHHNFIGRVIPTASRIKGGTLQLANQGLHLIHYTQDKIYNRLCYYIKNAKQYTQLNSKSFSVKRI